MDLLEPTTRNYTQSDPLAAFDNGPLQYLLGKFKQQCATLRNHRTTQIPTLLYTNYEQTISSNV